MDNDETARGPAEDPQLARAEEFLREGRTAAACAEYLRYADKCAARGDLMEAIKYYYKVEDYRLLDIKPRQKLATLLAQVGNKSRAVATFIEVADKYAAQGLGEEAADTLRASIGLLPDRLALRYRLAELFEQAGQTQKAVNIYLQVLERFPEEVAAWESLARLYAKRHSRDEAVDAFLRAIAINEQAGNLLAAAREYEAVVTLMDDNTGALKRLIELYGELGFKGEMVAKMVELARFYDARGEKERALTLFAKVIDVEPSHEEAQHRLGKSIQVVSVLPTGESLVRSEPPLPDAQMAEPELTPGETAFPPGRAIRTVEDLLGFHPDAGGSEISESPQVCYDLGLAYLEMGITEEAVHYLQLASRDLALRVRACNMLGTCFLDMDSSDMAVKEFERALATPHLTENDAVGIYYNLATACERLGDYRRALDELRKVYAIDINYLDVKDKLRKMRARVEG